MKEKTMKEKMLKGSAWMTAGSIISRILGAIYIIPWYSWFGDDRLQANALYTKGYTVYSVFLMIAISGIPSAVAKQVARYNSQNEYRISDRLFKLSFGVLFVVGIVATAVFWFLAPYISQGDKALVSIYRSLAVALLVIPTMSLLRGYFQGFQDMAPSAMSQLIEQFLRIIYMLAATYITIKVLDLPYEAGVFQSTFAAFIGAVGGMLLLVFYYLRKRKHLKELVQNSANKLKISDKKLLTDVFYQAIPFILIACALATFNLIDQFSFPVIMQNVTNASQAQINALYALFAGNANKLIMIVVAVATAMATTAIPLLSEAIAKKDSELMKEQLLNSLELLLFVSLPAVFGMVAVSRPLYTVFYGYDQTGVYVLAVSAYIALMMCLYNVLGALLQGIYENKRAIKYTLIGLVVKCVLQYPLTALLGVFGPLLATGIGMAWASYLMLNFLYVKYDLQTNELQRSFNKLFIISLVMFGVALLGVSGYYYIFSSNGRLVAVFGLVIFALLGGLIYVALCLKSGLFEKILGKKLATRVRKILRWG